MDEIPDIWPVQTSITLLLQTLLIKTVFSPPFSFIQEYRREVNNEYRKYSKFFIITVIFLQLQAVSTYCG